MKVSIHTRCRKFAQALSNHRACFLLPAVAMALLLSSCAVSGTGKVEVTHGDPGRGYYGSPPVDTEVPYYFFHDRYYFGGVWEEGNFVFNGFMNPGRYHYGNSRFYGGTYNPGYRVNLTQEQYDVLNRKVKNEKS